MRNEDGESQNEKAFIAKFAHYKGKGKFIKCTHCHKDGHEVNDCWHKGKPRCFNCKKFGHLAKHCRIQKEEDKDENMTQVAVEETIF